MTKETVRIDVRVPDKEFKEDAQAAAKSQGSTVSELVRKYLARLIKNHKTNKDK